VDIIKNMQAFDQWGFGSLLILALISILIIIGLLVALAKIGRGVDGENEKSAMDILDEQFEKGEISKDEYEKKKAILFGNGRDNT
jgi:uncharacterized membrane protein